MTSRKSSAGLSVELDLTRLGNPKPRIAKPASRPVPLELTIQHAIREALGKEPGLVLWRNHQGMVREFDDDGHENVSRAGLPVGSADLIGVLLLNVRIHGLCEEVPAPIGRFIAFEVKRPGLKAEPHQERWLAQVRMHGGFACIVHSVDEARAAIERARRGEYE